MSVGQSGVCSYCDAVWEDDDNEAARCPHCGYFAFKVTPPKPLVGAGDEHTPRGRNGV